MAKKKLTVRQLGNRWKKLADDPHAKEFLAMQLLLRKIAEMGRGMKPEIIDWQNIGKNAVHLARQHLQPKCKTCGQPVAEAQQAQQMTEKGGK